MRAPPGVLTFGHSTLERPAIASLLHANGVDAVLDVRRFPGSRRNPDVGTDALASWLPETGIAYRWDERLGGRRSAPPDSPDTWWQVAAFRGYAAHTRTPEFAAAVADLLRSAEHERVALMCSEVLWWRCHRRLIADVLTLAHHRRVEHLRAGAAPTEHVVAAGARLRDDGLLVYDQPADDHSADGRATRGRSAHEAD